MTAEAMQNLNSVNLTNICQYAAEDIVEAAMKLKALTPHVIGDCHVITVVRDLNTNVCYLGYNRRLREQLFSEENEIDQLRMRVSRAQVNSMKKQLYYSRHLTDDDKRVLERNPNACAEYDAYNMFYRTRPDAMPKESLAVSVTYRKWKYSAVKRCLNCLLYSDVMGYILTDLNSGERIPLNKHRNEAVLIMRKSFENALREHNVMRDSFYLSEQSASVSTDYNLMRNARPNCGRTYRVAREDTATTYSQHLARNPSREYNRGSIAIGEAHYLHRAGDSRPKRGNAHSIVRENTAMYASQHCARSPSHEYKRDPIASGKVHYPHRTGDSRPKCGNAHSIVRGNTAMNTGQHRARSPSHEYNRDPIAIRETYEGNVRTPKAAWDEERRSTCGCCVIL